MCNYQTLSRQNTRSKRTVWSKLTLQTPIKELWGITTKTECQLSSICKNHLRKSVIDGRNVHFSPFLTVMVVIPVLTFWETICISSLYATQNFHRTLDKLSSTAFGNQRCIFLTQLKSSLLAVKTCSIEVVHVQLSLFSLMMFAIQPMWETAGQLCHVKVVNTLWLSLKITSLMKKKSTKESYQQEEKSTKLNPWLRSRMRIRSQVWCVIKFCLDPIEFSLDVSPCPEHLAISRLKGQSTRAIQKW